MFFNGVSPKNNTKNMTLFDRLTVSTLLLLALMTVLLLFKPVWLIFMFIGLGISYGVHYLIQHPAWGRLTARVLAESVGLLLMLSFFVGVMLSYVYILGL